MGPMTGIINNGRMRKMYLPAEVLGGGFLREPDSTMTLDNTFKTMFFWIVSRANNCTYCSGHQEVKLLGDGIKEDTIAALDGDWSEFTEAERAAFAFTLKLTYEPNQLNDADIDRLRKHYTDLQILEIVVAVGGFNAMNRWTGPLAIPQEDHRVYLTATSDRYKNVRSRVRLCPTHQSPRRRRFVRGRLTGARSRPVPRWRLPSTLAAGGRRDCHYLPRKRHEQQYLPTGPARSTPRVGPTTRQFSQGGKGLDRPDLLLPDQGPAQPQAQSGDRLRRRTQ